MEVREKCRGNRADRHFDLIEPDGDAAPGI
jgi:hypothetical protein